MIDMHNDLLTVAYCCYLKNDYHPLMEFNELIKKGNIIGIMANLYFMTREEMDEELSPNYYKDTTILDMFIKAKEILNKYIPNIKFCYSIEGCDYIDINELEKLKEAGLNSLLLVWNNPNKYGSGVRSDYGLTEEGIAFINKAIDLHIGIDLSHANINTYNDIIKIVKERNYSLVYASHSNIRKIFEHMRNLNDEELALLKNVNGKLGLVAINYFTKDQEEYIEQIKYAIDVLGINNVMLSSDNMDFIGEEFISMRLFAYDEMNKIIRNELQKYYNEEEINKIMYQNALEIFNEEKER